MAAEPLCLSKDAVFLMNNMVMVITFSTDKAISVSGRQDEDYLVGGARTIQ
jgi:hypothetical protein